jgi:hydroxyacylglutathione hydrolase
MSLPFEDLFTDVLGKAKRGLKLSDDALAAQAGLSLEVTQAALAGAREPAALRALAQALGLHGESLIAMAEAAWRPEPVELPGLAQFNTPFDDYTVNAYLVWDEASGQAAAFDTGATATAMAKFIQAKGLDLTRIFITHTHPDLDTLRAVNPQALVLSHALEPVAGSLHFTIDLDMRWRVGALTIAPRLTTGHSVGGVSYYITGLARPVAVVGDALFASSMGGGMVSYAEALRTNRSQLFTLPAETVVCPGHGPLTSIGEEAAHNPFYPELKS